MISWNQLLYYSDATARRSFLQAVQEKGYEPLPYGEREELKRQGWQEVHDASLPLPARAAGAEKVLRAWFDRSLETAYLAGRQYWKKHPDFVHYVAMTLEQARGLGQSLFPEEVMDLLIAKYGLEFGLPVGSYWLPKKEWRARLKSGAYNQYEPIVLSRIHRFITSY